MIDLNPDWDDTRNLDGEVLCDLGDQCGYEWSVDALIRRNEDGQLFRYTDSGCSCNYPLQEVRSWDDLEPVHQSDWAHLPHEMRIAAAAAWNRR